MTRTITHQYDEVVFATFPGLEIYIVYDCESEIVFDEDGNEESNRLIDIKATINGRTADISTVKFLRESQGPDVRKFLALLRESARQALYAESLRG